MKDLKEVRKFCGIEVEKTEKGLILSQEKFVSDVLSRFGMKDCRSVATPFEKPGEIENDEEFQDKRKYSELIGCLMYLIHTRPDIQCAVRYLSQFCNDPKPSHFVGLKRILSYLVGTRKYGLVFENNGSDGLVGYADADFANDVSDRKSISGNILFLFDCPVMWLCKKQSLVAQSSTEAEFISLALCAQDVLWVLGIVRDLEINISTPVIKEDNKSTIGLLNKWEQKRTKHIDVKYRFLKDLVQNKEVIVEYVQSQNQLADIFTKSLGKILFEKLRMLIKCQIVDK